MLAVPGTPRFPTVAVPVTPRSVPTVVAPEELNVAAATDAPVARTTAPLPLVPFDRLAALICTPPTLYCPVMFILPPPGEAVPIPRPAMPPIPVVCHVPPSGPVTLPLNAGELIGARSLFIQFSNAVKLALTCVPSAMVPLTKVNGGSGQVCAAAGRASSVPRPTIPIRQATSSFLTSTLPRLAACTPTPDTASGGCRH